MTEKKENKTLWRPAPAGAYDVETMQKWLSRMALKGLFLTKDGFWGFIAKFERSSPAKVSYALTPARKSTSLFSADGGSPDDEQLELYEKYGWTYLGKRGEFFIWENREENARLLDTDPGVAALALESVKKRQFASLAALVLQAAVFSLFTIRGCFVLTTVVIKTRRMVLLVFMFFWVLAENLAAFIYLRGLQKRLLSGQTQKETEKKEKRVFLSVGGAWAKLIVKAAFICLLCFSMLSLWNEGVVRPGAVSLKYYRETLPFATIADFAESQSSDYKLTMTEMGNSFNTVWESSDIIAPRFIEYNEHAAVTLEGGETVSGGLNIEYFEMASPLLARIAARECYRRDSRNKNFSPVETPALAADYVSAYTTNAGFPILIIQKGSIFIRASFYQITESDTIDFNDWARVLCESLGKE